MKQGQMTFIERVGNAARADMARSGVLASMKTAQAILESEWGTSALTTKANALFVIKADSCWSGRVYSTATDDFHAYDSWEQSVADHSGVVMSDARYAHVLGMTDYMEACRAIHAAGYATDPDYSNQLIRLIQDYNLNEYDKKEER
jgi:flagellum-specific peptidoglycan hydrolase FlgJ